MEEENDGTARLRRDVPGDDPLAIGRGENDLLGRRQAGRDRRRVRRAARKIEQVALDDIKQRHRAGIAEERDAEPFQDGSWSHAHYDMLIAM